MFNNVGHIPSSIQTSWQKFLGSSNRIVVAAIAAIALVAVSFLALRYFAPRSFQNCFSSRPSSSIPQIPTTLPGVSSPLRSNPEPSSNRDSSKDLPFSETPLPQTPLETTSTQTLDASLLTTIILDPASEGLPSSQTPLLQTSLETTSTQTLNSLSSATTPPDLSSNSFPSFETTFSQISEQIASTSSSETPQPLQSLLDSPQLKEMDSNQTAVISALRADLLPYTLLQTSRGSLIEKTRSFTSFVENESQKILDAKLPYFAPAPTIAEITPQDGNWQSLTVQVIGGWSSYLKPVVIDVDSHNFEGRFGSSYVQFASCIGPRDEMEDTHIASVLQNGIRVVGVFDGHGGDHVAQLARDYIVDLLNREFEQMGGGEDLLSEEDLLERSILALNNAFIQLDIDAYELLPTINRLIDPGTTAIVTLIVGNKLVVANLGDSRAVLVRDDRAVQLTLDAEPNIPRFDEQVRALGGIIYNNRVFGSLATPAAIGDHRNMSISEDKRKSIVNIPEISLFEFVPGRDRVVIGCDGQWDPVSVNEIFQTLQERLSATVPTDVSDATILARTALLTRPKPGEGRYPNDNVTVAVINL